MLILSNSTNTKHSDTFFSFCQEAEEIMVASPFCFPDFKWFADRVAESGTVKNIVFVTTLKKEEVALKIDYLLSFRDEMNRIGVEWELRIDNHLHGKVYIFKKSGQPYAGIVTSANLTNNGLIANHEWGCVIEDVSNLVSIEKQILADAKRQFNGAQLDRIKNKVKEKYPTGVPKPEPIEIDIDDIMYSYDLPKGTRIFIKPIGDTQHPIFSGDFSQRTTQHFSKTRPAAVRIGDIMIDYAVGSTKIVGAYRIISAAVRIGDENTRWPWRMEAENLTPNLSNHLWEEIAMHVTREANQYYEKYKKPITNRGGHTLGALNRGCDKVRLDDEYGSFLLGKVLKEESKITSTLFLFGDKK